MFLNLMSMGCTEAAPLGWVEQRFQRKNIESNVTVSFFRKNQKLHPLILGITFDFGERGT